MFDKQSPVDDWKRLRWCNIWSWLALFFFFSFVLFLLKLPSLSLNVVSCAAASCWRPRQFPPRRAHLCFFFCLNISDCRNVEGADTGGGQAEGTGIELRSAPMGCSRFGKEVSPSYKSVPRFITKENALGPFLIIGKINGFLLVTTSAVVKRRRLTECFHVAFDVHAHTHTLGCMFD